MSDDRNSGWIGQPADTAEDGTYQLPAEYGIEVYQNTQGMIVIKQDDPMGEDHLVIVSPERADHLVRFIQGVKEQILTEHADRAAHRNASGPRLT
jgi:hypothetical protein